MQLIKNLLTIAMCASMVSAWCHDSVSCAVGGNTVCNEVCVRQGNPNGGRCMPRDGCSGNTICACYPRKRSDKQIDGDEVLLEVMEETVVPPSNVEERNPLEKRSVCCSLPGSWAGACCEAHCDYIGKPGGQCSDKNVCTCN
ncbi:hypothetical protein G7Z17_g2128 [Cylindrodendrum hubeiense]|uniref:Invertebrate defensins family profile domain-containing protein n=1 Tax=Cylindrodendrum hubeiense TaxID=595255 RepID=A0A9P5LJE7_9HYPO|nr:hypothetical protein G7Z17_g2128 [Cylindrodendrum hubeiense]